MISSELQESSNTGIDDVIEESKKSKKSEKEESLFSDLSEESEELGLSDMSFS